MSDFTTTTLHIDYNEKVSQLIKARNHKDNLYSELMKTPLGIQYMRAKADLNEIESELGKIEDKLVELT